jgi:predicted secreted protein
MLGNAGNTFRDESMRLSENDSGKTIALRAADELELILPTKPDTDYVWEVSSLDLNVLKLSATNFIASDKAIGAGGIEIIRFHPIAMGQSKVKLIFHKPFEQQPPLKTFDVTVIIKK